MIRSAAPEDVAAMVRCGGRPIPAERNATELIAAENDLCVVADLGGVIGWGAAGYRSAGFTYPGWYILHSYVHPDHQDRGVGAQLMDHRLRWLRLQGAHDALICKRRGATVGGPWGFAVIAIEFTYNGRYVEADEGLTLWRAEL